MLEVHAPIQTRRKSRYKNALKIRRKVDTRGGDGGGVELDIEL